MGGEGRRPPASGFPRHDLHEWAAGPNSSSGSRQASLSLLARTPPARSPSGIILISLFGAESDCMEYELDDHTPRTCPDARLSQRIGGAKLCAAPAAGQRRPDRRKGISHPSRTGDGAPFLAEIGRAHV